MKRSTLMTQYTQKPCEIVDAFLCCRKKRILYWIFQTSLLLHSVLWCRFSVFFIPLVYNKYTAAEKRFFLCVVNIFIKCHALHDVTECLLFKGNKKMKLSYRSRLFSFIWLQRPQNESSIFLSPFSCSPLPLDDLFTSGAFYFSLNDKDMEEANSPWGEKAKLQKGKQKTYFIKYSLNRRMEERWGK